MNRFYLEGKKADGTSFTAAFCDVFEMEDSKIKRLIGYISEIK